MKKLLLFFAAMLVAGSMWGATYTKITSLDGLVAGAKYLIVYESSATAGKAMTTTATTTNTKRLTPADVTISSSSISTTATNIVWTLSGSTDAWMFNNGTNYVNGTGSGAANCTGTSSNGNKYDITANTDGTFHLQIHGNADRVLEYNTVGPYFAHYKSTLADVCLYKESTTASGYALTLATNTNGSFTASVNGSNITSGSTVAAGATVTISATPNSGYSFNAWNCYKTANQYNYITVSESNTFTMPSEAVTVDAYFLENAIAAPTLSLSSGKYTSSQTVTVTNFDENYYYFYTTDGSDPSYDDTGATGATMEYTNNESGITINATTTLKMLATDGENNSDIATATYTFPDYSVTIVDPENGTLAVKNGGNTVNSGDKFFVGDVISITANPAEGYKFRNIQVVDASTHTFTSSNTKDWEMGAANITVKANFDQIVTRTITWSVNGNTTTLEASQVEDGENITFPTNVDDIFGKKFVGWSSNVNASAASDIVSRTVTATANETYYAVFATLTPGENETAVITCDTTAARNTYWEKAVTDSKGYAWSMYTNIATQDINNVAHYYYGLNSNASGYVITSPTFPGNIVSIKAYVWNTSSKKTRYAYLCSSNENKQPESGDLGSLTIASSSKNAEMTFTLTSEPEFNHFYLYSSTEGAVGFESIEVTYGTPDTYSNYCTSVYSRNVTAGNYGTICLPYEVTATNRSGATFYELVDKTEENGNLQTITMEEVEGALTAGKPYIFKASADKLVAYYSGEAVTEVETANGLIGNINAATTVAYGKYVVSGTKFWKVDSEVSLGQYRAYIDAEEINKVTTPSQARRIVLAADGTEGTEVATDVESIDANEKAVKFIENGVLYIQKNGRVYNAMGQIVK